MARAAAHARLARGGLVVWVAGVFTLLDFLGDKVPVVDHALQAAHVFLAPVSGALAAGATDPTGGASLWAVAGIGALNALGIHAAKTTTRLGGSAASLGTLTPAMSLVEDLLAVGGLAMAALSPYALVGAIALLAVATVAVVRRWRLRTVRRVWTRAMSKAWRRRVRRAVWLTQRPRRTRTTTFRPRKSSTTCTGSSTRSRWRRS